MNDLPNVSFVGRSVSRREDQRLLTGRGQFIADLALPHMLHAVFVRSPVAHARIKAIDLSRAAAFPGIVYALSGPELARQLPPVPDTQLALPSKWTTLVQHKFINPQQPLLACDKVRHVGEAVAVILAESRYAAEDAAELVTLDLDPLPPVLDPEAALRPDAALIHERFETNLMVASPWAKATSLARWHTRRIGCNVAFIIIAMPPCPWNAVAWSGCMIREQIP
jgi:carbon-monoxide dehydrogenase large subunit